MDPDTILVEGDGLSKQYVTHRCSKVIAGN